MIEVREVTKIYKAKGKEIVGVKNVSLSIDKGRSLGLSVTAVPEKVHFFAA